jgi:dihydroorotate dehydrogenase electron transfer subunit
VNAAPAGAEPRTLAPPGRRLARVTANEAVGPYRLISALDADGPLDPRPGQFYMLAAAERWGGGGDERPYLPRAFSYARARSSSERLQLEFLLDAVGPGTERLGALEPGEDLALVGPLGVGFRTPPQVGCPLLVGGGIGVAPLVCLAGELTPSGTVAPSRRVDRPGTPPPSPTHGGSSPGPGATGNGRPVPVTVLLGFRSAAHAEAARLFPGEAALATEDGSAGRRALVTELLREELERDPGVTVYSCGPPPMLEAVRALCRERGVPAQLALETGMACGFGACFGCAVPVRDGYLRLCVEGPVLDAHRIETALFPGAGH